MSNQKQGHCGKCKWWDGSVLPTQNGKFVGTVNINGGNCTYPKITDSISSFMPGPFVHKDFGCIFFKAKQASPKHLSMF